MEWILANKEGMIIFGVIVLIAIVALAIYKYVKLEQVTVTKKKISTSAWVIPFVIFSLFGFTAIAVYVQIRTGIELSSTLITCFFAFCTGELWMLASIKKTRLKNGEETIGNIINNITNRGKQQEECNEENQDNGGDMG
jgi:tryptophan-rich sensory protein